MKRNFEDQWHCECGNSKPPKQIGCDTCRAIEKQRAVWDKAELAQRAADGKREKLLDAQWGIIDN